MEQAFLSNIDLFFADKIENGRFYLEREEAKHAVSVLRNKIGDTIYVTDGKGNIFRGIINQISKKGLIAEIIERNFYPEIFPNITFYVPLLKNKERFRFMLEKLTELGFTRINIFRSERTIPQNFNSEKWLKILRSALKQSLNPHLPKLEFFPSILNYTKERDVENILLSQNADETPNNFTLLFNEKCKFCIFVGPEGDFTEKEKEVINPKMKITLGRNRFRTETAVISFASFVALGNVKKNNK